MKLALHLIDTLALSWMVIWLYREALMSVKTSCLSNSRGVLVSLPRWEDETVLKTHLNPKVWCLPSH